ncbi:hypothetical protein KDX23_09580 [Burkholderia vietnamiensis]|uniref:hypothetical protein n=1 Tax=Burkholderia vietnamiensis TaxID=60552 RepID=UPI001B953CC5|nr:hypothetical protein [Burkholderia vietnamiensis]MBR8082992.1 hypothetical protein [Burkholderia vietnamiensis]
MTTKTIQTSPLLSSLLHEFLDDRALAVLLNISEKTPLPADETCRGLAHHR